MMVHQASLTERAHLPAQSAIEMIFTNMSMSIFCSVYSVSAVKIACTSQVVQEHTLNMIVHPKIKMLSSYTQPHVVPNLYSFLSVNIKEDILKNAGYQTVDGPHCLWKSMGTNNCLVLQNKTCISFFLMLNTK